MGLGVGSIVSVGGFSSASGTSSGGGSSSGTTKFAASFINITSGIFTHSLGTEDVLVQVYNNQSPRRQILPDEIRIENSNQVSLLFNALQSGRVVII